MKAVRLGWNLDFGNPWMTQWFYFLETYLNAFTTARNNEPFKLAYNDVFAETGRIMRKPSQSREADE